MGELGVLRGEEASTAAALGSSASALASAVTTLLSGIVLSGMLTVIIGRAVFGAGITIGEAWQRVRGRFLPLIGYTLLWLLAVAVPVFAVVFVIAVLASLSGAAAFVVAVPLVLGLIALLVYLWTVLSFAAPLIVLERLGVVRCHQAVDQAGEGRLLAGARDPAAGHPRRGRRRRLAVSIPFSLGGQILLLGWRIHQRRFVIALVLVAIGGAVGQIITAPFSAGAVVLLYTDRRMRAEAFDLVLQTGAAYAAPGAAPDSTDHLWLTRQH